MSLSKVLVVLLLSALVAGAFACGGGSGGKATPAPSVTSTASRTPQPTATPLASQRSGSFDSVYFVDDLRGWVAGAKDGKGVILATSDGGATWREQFEYARPIDDLQFVSSAIGWAVAHSPGSRDVDPDVLLHTTNAGQDWHIEYKFVGSVTVDFATESVGYALSAGALFRTDDGGAIWTSLPIQRRLGTICFDDGTVGWATDRLERGAIGGEVLRTRDGGRTWSTLFTPPPGLINGAGELSCRDKDVAWTAVWGRTDPGHAHGIFRTIDGGESWREVLDYGLARAGTVPDGARDGEAIAILDASAALMVGYKDGGNVLKWTFDGGISWGAESTIPPGPAVKRSFSFVDARHGWIVGGTTRGRDNLILATTDGGQTWTQQYP